MLGIVLAGQPRRPTRESDQRRRRLRAARRTLRVVVALSLAAGVAATAAGCDTAAEAGAFGSGGIVNDVATRLANADTEAYTASYSLADEQTVTITHSPAPDRTAYGYPDGTLLLTARQATLCRTVGHTHTCTAGPPTQPGAALPLDLRMAIEHGGLVRPEMVITMLTEVSLNADAVIAESDATLAGTHATCVAVTGLSKANDFSVCVTSEGLLGSFVGSPDGVPVDISLDRYTLAASEGAFLLPKGAKIARSDPSR